MLRKDHRKMTDEALMALSAMGDNSAFTHLYDRYAKKCITISTGCFGMTSKKPTISRKIFLVK
jgi:hypothetical protein